MYIIAGKYYRRKIASPKGAETRPTSSRLRETVFNIIQEGVEGSDFLDVFAGTGAMGIEALSRGAKRATFIEGNPGAIQTLKDNLKSLEITHQGNVMFGDYIKNLKILGNNQGKFDIIFADAPYHLKDAASILLNQIIANQLLKAGGKVFIENDEPLLQQNFSGLVHLNSRKSGKSYLHLFQKDS